MSLEKKSKLWKIAQCQSDLKSTIMLGMGWKFIEIKSMKTLIKFNKHLQQRKSLLKFRIFSSLKLDQKKEWLLRKKASTNKTLKLSIVNTVLGIKLKSAQSPSIVRNKNRKRLNLLENSIHQPNHHSFPKRNVKVLTNLI